MVLPFANRARGAPAPAIAIACVLAWADPSFAQNAAGPAFQVVPGLSPLGADAAARPAPPKGLDLKAHDEEQIVVYAKRGGRDFPAAPDNFYTPSTSLAAPPFTPGIVPPNTCPNAAYTTVAGQPANGADLVGLLGSGACD
jgi:hypothetical protein